MLCFDDQKEYPILRNLNEIRDAKKRIYLDVRTPEECKETGTIKGAYMIELRKLNNSFQQLK